jgi:hypothetical protein
MNAVYITLVTSDKQYSSRDSNLGNHYTAATPGEPEYANLGNELIVAFLERIHSSTQCEAVGPALQQQQTLITSSR